MRKHEIQKAMESGTTLALMPDGISGPASQVKVTSMTGTSQVPTAGLRMYRTHAAPGITVQSINNAGKPGDTFVVASVKLISTWHDYQLARESEEAARSTKAQLLDRSRTEAEEAASLLRDYLSRSGVENGREVVEVVGVGGGFSHTGEWSNPRSFAVRIAPAVVRRLLLAAPIKGRNAP